MNIERGNVWNQFLVSSALVSLYAVTKVYSVRFGGPLFARALPAGGYGGPFLRLCICNAVSVTRYSPAYWLKNLLHWCNNNEVLIVDISRVYANSLPQAIGKKQDKSVPTQCISANFQWYTKKRRKTCFRNTNILNYQPGFDNSSVFLVKYQSLTKFSITWLVSRQIL